MEQWYVLVHAHHSGEEKDIFPIIETLAGQKGIMDANVEQHHVFEKGIDAMNLYVKACLIDQDKYDGTKVKTLIDAFAPDLVTHLRDEITTLLGLRSFGNDRLQNLMARFAHVGKQQMAEVGMLTGGMSVLVGHDVGYEGGLHKGFPPAPAPLIWGLRNVGWWVHSDWWKFGPCDRLGNLKPLHAIPVEAKA